MTPPDSGDKLRKIAAKLTERGPMPSSILTSSDKPDSGDPQHECRCGYRVVGRDAEGAHTWSECEPDSGEREVRLSATTIDKIERNAGHVISFLGKVGRPHVLIPLSLAQRILAALEGRGDMAERYALRDELRAAVERKP